MASLTLRGIRKKLGTNPILRGIDLTIQHGEFTVIVGPSGCGKSTLLRTIAGLEEPDEGTIHLEDRDVTHLPPRDRDVGMVFQSYALYPHLTVRENIAFGLRLRKTEETIVQQRVNEVAEMLSLGSLLDRFPREMSGGQRQRVAMGRAIARRPVLFLFDEPLSNLDAALRAQVRVEIKKLHAQLGTTMVYVTHDQVEAMTLADRLVVLNAGRLEQQGPPLEVYNKPQSRFVAGFLGSPPMNFLSVRVASDGMLRGDGISLRHHPTGDLKEGTSLTLGVRPHELSACSSAESNVLTMNVEVVEAMGFEAFAYGRVGSSAFVTRIDTTQPNVSLPRAGDTLSLTARASSFHLFHSDTGMALSATEASP